MKKLLPTALLMLLLSGCHPQQSRGLFSFNLPEASGESLDFSSLHTNKTSVFVFLAPDCPLSQNYTLTLNALRKEFAGNAFGVYGVIAGNLYTDTEVHEFVRKYNIEFPLLLDRDFALADYFGAEVTPQVFATGSDSKVAYTGAIDNWAEALGQHRVEATQTYLHDALEDLRQGRAPRVTTTRPVGCFIERTSLSDTAG